MDTLTCTAPWDADGDNLVDLAKALMEDERRQGSKVTPFKRAVFKGQQTAHAAWAQHDGRVLLEIRGRTAHDWWDVALPLAHRVSRLDLEVSVFQQPFDSEMAIRYYLAGVDAAREKGRPARLMLVGETTGGTTLYIGRGASRYQARMYEAAYKHKGEGLENCWRYEIQCRRERAVQMADQLRRAGDLQPFVQAAVHQHFERRGVHPIYDPTAHTRIPPLPKGETDKEKSLGWLGRSVAPALNRHRAWGSYEEAKHALGVDK